MEVTRLHKVDLHLHLDFTLGDEVVSQINPAITPEQYRSEFTAPPKVYGSGSTFILCSQKLSTNADRRASSPCDP